MTNEKKKSSNGELQWKEETQWMQQWILVTVYGPALIPSWNLGSGWKREYIPPVGLGILVI